MTGTNELPQDREKTAARLLRSSEEHSFDPAEEIDWDEPLAEDAYFSPPHRLSLYGTDLWQRMDRDQRIALSRHEVASIASTGIFFETVLMRMLLRYVEGCNPTTQHAQYALTETGDECRHSVMFGRMIDRLGCPPYPVSARARHLSNVLYTPVVNDAVMFGATLYVEEILDALQREAMDDDSLQPLVRQVSRLHVIEEARHMRYAAEEMARQVDGMSRLDEARTKLLLPMVSAVAAGELIHPDVYVNVGLDRGEAVRAARANPHWRDTRRWAGRKAYREYRRLGLMDGIGRRAWERTGLV